MRFTGDVVFQYLHQARFPNARLALQYYDLTHARFDPRPALHQELHFWLAPH